MASVSAFIRQSLDGLVHASAAADPLVAARHRAFIGSHLAVGFAALAAFPGWLALAGPTSGVEALTFALLIAPLGLAAFLSQSGRFEAAQLASSLLLTALIAWLTWLTGGIASPVLIAMVLVPLEASLSGSLKLTGVASAFAGFGATGVYLLGQPPADAMLATGSLVPLLVSLAATAYAALLVVRQQLVHRLADRTARLGEERYRLLADNATDLITLHDLGGRTLFASPASRALFGAGASELVGNGLFDHVHVADRPAFLTALSESANAGRPAAAEVRIRRGRSRAASDDAAGFIWAELRCRPALDANGATVAVVAVTRDISSRKSLETEAIAARETAEQANAAKSRFLAMMSHELRTPLNAIIGFSDILKSGVVPSNDIARRHDYARLIHESGEHLLQVVNSLLDMSKIEAGKFEIRPEPFQLGQVLDSCVEIMGSQAAERQVTIDWREIDELPEIVADQRAVRQILLNLLSNAVKFSKPGGQVTVRAQRTGQSLAITVSDTGIGIRPDDLERLGIPFEQVDSSYDRRYEGTGLGLSVVKGLVALHGGSFAIASEPDSGTTATVTLPIVPGSAVQSLRQAGQPNGLSGTDRGDRRIA